MTDELEERRTIKAITANARQIVDNFNYVAVYFRAHITECRLCRKDGDVELTTVNSAGKTSRLTLSRGFLIVDGFIKKDITVAAHFDLPALVRKWHGL